ncbi:hypothetical protein WJX84_002311 [Apatococcus fuscideae]|uniref:Uncharacterized protein n=1 Tax=Apatococcus fuscideae TaxID=2026836 RepID=A0AAW1TDK1_9CHLO
MGLKAKETFDANFALDDAAEERLRNLLVSETFSKQVVQQCQLPAGQTCKFSGILFQPVPWSVTTKKGMPQEYEQYLTSLQHVIINVPPNFMFQAKIFKPSRLCAIFETY